MARSSFSGPIASDNGFEGFVQLPTSTTAELPASGTAGELRAITDNGSGNDEFAVVVWNGSAWTLTTGAALS